MCCIIRVALDSRDTGITWQHEGIDLAGCVLFSLRSQSETAHLYGRTEHVESMESNRYMNICEFQVVFRDASRDN